MPIPILAASDEMTPEQYRRIIVASLIIIVLIIAAFVIVTMVRRRLRAEDDLGSSGGIGFTLSDLRQLHKSGKMSAEEFERAKAKILQAAARAGDRQGAAGATSLRDHRQARSGAELETKPSPGGADEEGLPPA